MFDDLLGNSGVNQRFASAQNNHDAVDPQEAADYVGQFMRQAPPQMQQQVLQQYVSQLDPQQRQALAQAMIQHQGTPVQDVRYDDDNDLTDAFMRSGQALSNPQAQQAGGGLGGLFGMFGNMLGGQQGGMGQGGMGQSSGGFGQDQYGQQGYGQQQSPMGGVGGGLGQMLQNPMARAGLVSLAAVIGSQLLGANRR